MTATTETPTPRCDTLERAIRLVERLIETVDPPPTPGSDSGGFGDRVKMQVVKDTATEQQEH